LKDPFHIAVREWFDDRGDETLRLDYPLNSQSIVLDVGGYMGDWANSIFEKYGAVIHVFEPVSSFYTSMENRFLTNLKVTVHHYGLSDSSKNVEIALQEDGSSTVRFESDRKERIKLVDIVDFIDKYKIEEIDLIKINIEGGEYELLERMFEMDIIKKCKNLQIQFHDFYPESKKCRASLREKLRLTHQITYDYYFVWENWVRL
jgi:FkbM family methyltransferase